MIITSPFSHSSLPSILVGLVCIYYSIYINHNSFSHAPFFRCRKNCFFFVVTPRKVECSLGLRVRLMRIGGFLRRLRLKFCENREAWNCGVPCIKLSGLQVLKLNNPSSVVSSKLTIVSTIQSTYNSFLRCESINPTYPNLTKNFLFEFYFI